MIDFSSMKERKSMAAVSQKHAHLLVIPFPAPGHILPLLDLIHQFSSRFGLSVTVVVTPKNLSHLSPLLSRCPAVASLVLPFPANPLLPPGAETAQDASTAQEIRVLFRALAGLHEPILHWARSRGEERPTIILSDFLCGWTECLAADLGVHRLVFCPSGAFCLSVVHSLWRRMPVRSDPDDPHEPIGFPDLPNSPSFPWREMPPSYRYYLEGDSSCEFVKAGFLANTSSWGFVFNTFSALEKPYIDHLRADLGHERVWSVGPLASGGWLSSAMEDEIMNWLDGCAEASVVYVAFGSVWVPSPAQVQALAAGLERSGARFVWVTRGAVAVPQGFEERVAGRGLVIRMWAPQVAILNHVATGAFLTHCGWNSVLESLAAGVPLLTWPMNADQFTNSKLLEEGVGTGLRACEGGEAVPDPKELARLVAGSLGETGRARRNKARELGMKASDAVGEGGSSSIDLVKMVELLRGTTS